MGHDDQNFPTIRQLIDSRRRLRRKTVNGGADRGDTTTFGGIRTHSASHVSDSGRSCGSDNGRTSTGRNTKAGRAIHRGPLHAGKRSLRFRE